MRLCFGTFTTVLNLCRQNILQATLIARIVACVDPSNSSIIKNYLEIREQVEICGTIAGKIDGNEQAISKLLACKTNFVFADREDAKIPTQNTIIKRFETLVTPFIDEDKKAKIILTLLNIIKKDNFLDFEKKETFKKYLGMGKQDLLHQSEFIFSDFMGRILLYTACGNINNKVGNEYVKDITNDYIDNIAKPYVYEYHWNTLSQTLTLSFMKIFNIFQQALQDYQLHFFIEEVDPTNYMNINNLEKCDEFLEFTKMNIWLPFGQESICWMLKKIQDFAQTLQDYTIYLGNNTRPIAEKPSVFVPLFRDENPKWALSFKNKTMNYRQQIISIYQEIYKHMLFA